VGAVNDSDQIASFSSRGPTADGRVKPDLVYPGVGIVAPQADGTRLGTVVEPGYVSADGTSMATPHAAGVAALMLQAKPELTAEQVKNQMVASAINLGALPNAQGAGRGDAYRAYLAVTGGVLPEPPPPPPNPDPSEPAGCLASLFGQRK